MSASEITADLAIFHAFWKAQWKLIGILELLCNNPKRPQAATDQNLNPKLLRVLQSQSKRDAVIFMLSQDIGLPRP
jgi:hypothetical protein